MGRWPRTGSPRWSMSRSLPIDACMLPTRISCPVASLGHARLRATSQRGQTRTRRYRLYGLRSYTMWRLRPGVSVGCRRSPLYLSNPSSHLPARNFNRSHYTHCPLRQHSQTWPRRMCNQEQGRWLRLWTRKSKRSRRRRRRTRTNSLGNPNLTRQSLLRVEEVCSPCSAARPMTS